MNVARLLKLALDLKEPINEIIKVYDKHKVGIHKIALAIAYLRDYGYLKQDIEITVENFIKALRIFLKFYNFDENDGLSPKVLKLMENPNRCGCPDIMELQTEEARWRKNKLTYFVSGEIGDGITLTQYKQTLAKAWGFWMEVANISVKEVANSNGADIIIKVGRGSQLGFDGPSGTLAWANLPNGSDSRLQMYFDLDERWTLNGNGVYLLNVATHEMGHLLGLTHSNVQSALMAPYYSPNIVKPQNNDDIPRIRKYYGAAVEPPPPPPPPPVDPTDPTNPPKAEDYVIRFAGGKLTVDGYRLTKIGE